MKRSLQLALCLTSLLLPVIAQSQGFQNVSVFNLPGNITGLQLSGIAVQGNYAYTTWGDSGLYIIDISNRSLPHIEGLAHCRTNAVNVLVEDNYAFVSNCYRGSATTGMQIIDISNPAAPVEVSYYTTMPVYAIDVQGNYAYLATYQNPGGSFEIVNIADMASPVWVSSLYAYNTRDVAVEGNYAFLAANGTTRVISISDPLAPYEVTTFIHHDYTYPVDLKIQEPFIYAAVGYSFEVYNISDPQNPGYVGQWLDNTYAIKNISIQGDLLYSNLALGGHHDNIGAFDISNPANPMRAGKTEYTMYLAISGVCADSDYVYATARDSGLIIYQFQPVYGAVTGIVRDRDTNEPIPGAIVRALPSQACDTADVNGSYTLDNLYPFTYTLSFSRDFYFDTTYSNIQVMQNDTVTFDAVMSPRPMKDVGATSILSPKGKLFEGRYYPLISVVKNFGTATQTYDVVCSIRYQNSSEIAQEETVTVTGQLSGHIDTVTFPTQFTPKPDSNYSIFSFTILPGDLIPDNDSAMVSAQGVHEFYLIYGRRDGTPMPVAVGSTIEIPIWGATARNNFVDSVTFMHLPLSTNDTIITDRQGGYFPDTLVGRWDDRSFRLPTPDTITGWTNQSVLGFAEVIGPINSQNFFWTDGDTVLIGTYIMTLADNPNLIGETVSPFREGFDSQQGGLAWGMQNGIDGAVPVTTYPSLIVLGLSSCPYLPGDLNNNGQTNGIDVTYGVGYFKGGPVPPMDCYPYCPVEPDPFYAAGDVNGNCLFNGIDITYFVSYLKGQQPTLHFCATCPPSVSLKGMQPQFKTPMIKATGSSANRIKN
jgi:hypothetical protein